MIFYEAVSAISRNYFTNKREALKWDVPDSQVWKIEVEDNIPIKQRMLRCLQHRYNYVERIK